jgi:hypothetical protein
MICIIIGGAMELLAFLKSDNWGTFVDIIHNIIIVPVFLFLLVTMIPITYLSGDFWQKVITFFCFSVWFLLFLSDIEANRLNESAWFEANGFSIFLHK